jgi:hypothetical protein
MKTDDLIEMLSRQNVAVDRQRLMLRWLGALGVGFAISMIVFVWMFEINPDLRMLTENVWFWVRFSFLALVMVLGGWFFSKLSKPAAASRMPFWIVGLPFVVIALVGAIMLISAEPEDRRAMLLGVSWTVCSRNIALLAVPIFFAAVWVARQFAPVQLRLTGAMLGLFSGGAAALMYSMYCPEMEPMFLAIWYSLGMIIPALVGALLGRKLLAW